MLLRFENYEFFFIICTVRISFCIFKREPVRTVLVENREYYKTLSTLNVSIGFSSRSYSNHYHKMLCDVPMDANGNGKRDFPRVGYRRKVDPDVSEVK